MKKIFILVVGLMLSTLLAKAQNYNRDNLSCLPIKIALAEPSHNPFVFEVGIGSTAPAPDHITFMGNPVRGTLSKFVKRMEREGFKNPIIKDGWATLEGGTFAGLEGCDLTIYALGKKSPVYSVCVRFASQRTWETLYYNYIYLKLMLTKKYGEPALCIEDNVDSLGGDKEIFEALKSGKAVYISTYKIPEGTIVLCIESLGYRKQTFVTLTYTDQKNSESTRVDFEDDL